MKILLVDDDLIPAQGLARYLESHGHVITQAKNGSEALECLKSHEYDVMLTDLVMPVMNGVDLINKASEINRLPPTVVLTGLDKWWGKFDGVVTAISKPADPEEVEEALIKASKEKI